MAVFLVPWNSLATAGTVNSCLSVLRVFFRQDSSCAVPDTFVPVPRALVVKILDGRLTLREAISYLILTQSQDCVINQLYGGRTHLHSSMELGICAANGVTEVLISTDNLAAENYL